MVAETKHDLSRNALVQDGNLHSQNLVRALLWLIERELGVDVDDDEMHLHKGDSIAELLRDDLRLLEWARRPLSEVLNDG